MKINKDLLYAFLVVLLISVFASVVGNIFRESNEKELTELRHIQEAMKEEKKLSEQREKRAESKSDSAMLILGKQTDGINLMNKNLNNLNFNILSMKSLYDKDYYELKTYQNEKDHVIDTSLSEQFDFLSKYRYKEYSGNANP
ncbi:hypothetical protein ACVVIH_06930 [Chryseobacterium arthrosphaerae]